MKLHKWGALIFITMLAQGSKAQLMTPVPGTNTEKPPAMTQKEELPFAYDPIDPEFWDKIKEAEAENNFAKIIVLAGDLLNEESNGSSDEADEARLALGIGLARLNISFGATQILKGLAKTRNGSKIGEAALIEMSKIAQSRFYDQEEIAEDLLVSNEFAPYHSDVESFIGFHAGLYSLTRGFKDWTEKEFSKIKPGTYWDYKMRYLKALGEIARDRVENGKQKLEELRLDELVPTDIRERARLQSARLAFEQGDFRNAYQLYTNLNLPIRTAGRIFVERAWSQFYLKNYSKALGLLEVSKAPVFSSSDHPERYVLGMLIYRELCHYESVITTAEQYRDRFGDALDAIRARGDLQKVPIIANMAMSHEKIQSEVNFLNQTRDEYLELQDLDWDEYDFYDELLKAYEFKNEDLKGRIDHMILEKSREIAQQIVDVEEQIVFLDYSAKLDQLRIVRRGENRNYKSESFSLLRFDKLFWPVEGEHWVDELEDYTMLIRSRCGESQLSTGQSESAEDFE